MSSVLICWGRWPLCLTDPLTSHRSPDHSERVDPLGSLTIMPYWPSHQEQITWPQRACWPSGVANHNALLTLSPATDHMTTESVLICWGRWPLCLTDPLTSHRSTDHREYVDALGRWPPCLIGPLAQPFVNWGSLLLGFSNCFCCC